MGDIADFVLVLNRVWQPCCACCLFCLWVDQWWDG